VPIATVVIFAVKAKGWYVYGAKRVTEQDKMLTFEAFAKRFYFILLKILRGYFYHTGRYISN
jgi:hypothetical protein